MPGQVAVAQVGDKFQVQCNQHPDVANDPAFSADTFAAADKLADKHEADAHAKVAAR